MVAACVVLRSSGDAPDVVVCAPDTVVAAKARLIAIEINQVQGKHRTLIQSFNEKPCALERAKRVYQNEILAQYSYYAPETYPAHSSTFVPLNFEAANIIDNRLAPAVDVRPGTIADTVACARYVHHIAASVRSRHPVVRLLIGNHEDAVVRRAQAGQRVAQPGSTVWLAGYNRIAQCKAATRRYPHEIVG